MIDFDALHRQNHRITETATVLIYLTRERALCDADTTRQLFLDAVSMIDHHLQQVDRLVKVHLLAHADPRDQNLGRKLSAESALLRRNFEEYAKHWTGAKGREMRIGDHERFIRDSDELFNLMLDRIQRETELIYPLLRRVSATGRAAA